jgi:hypothetical protein
LWSAPGSPEIATPLVAVILPSAVNCLSPKSSSTISPPSTLNSNLGLLDTPVIVKLPAVAGTVTPVPDCSKVINSGAAAKFAVIVLSGETPAAYSKN